jgi:hypothetical protein
LSTNARPKLARATTRRLSASTAIPSALRVVPQFIFEIRALPYIRGTFFAAECTHGAEPHTLWS